ncbi:MAG: GNAT family N-acetyltransferase [Planctomycetes bacterium]|nr:GNAT family N-acetyltransferase [Planctomycetota bacterium]
MLKDMSIKHDSVNIKINILRCNDIGNDIVNQWSDLEGRAAYGNAFLSPNFILPAVKYLTPDNAPLFLIVTKTTNIENKMIGMGIFEYSLGTKKFPLPHLKAYRTPHSYLGGLLIDDENMQISLDAIFRYINKSRYLFGIEFVDHVEDTELARNIEISAMKYNMDWYLDKRKKRAILVPHKIDQNYIALHYPSKRMKSIRRKYNYLSKLGEVLWSITSGRRVDESVIDRFLQLEHMGWKGEEGSSLLSNPNNEIFFREMIGNFLRNEQAFFTELSVNDQVVASTSNLISSKVGFAFKLGWDIKFAQASPGILNEFEFLKNGAILFHDLKYIDSGAEEGSFMENIWPDRIILRSGIYAKNNIAKPVMKVFNSIRKYKCRTYDEHKCSVL